MTDNFGLYDSRYEHDNCGVGFVVNIQGKAEHGIVQDGITILKNLVHRGALGGDLKTGDGAGMITQIPHEFFCKQGLALPESGAYGVGFFFMPQLEEDFNKVKRLIQGAVNEEGGRIAGWRDVPVCPDCLGEMARSSMPRMVQLFVTVHGVSGDPLERRLYIIRKVLERKAASSGYSAEQFYAVSLSCRTIVYKGMFVAPQFESFYPDLADPDFTSALALVHQRYSTNTFPSWPLAQPFRYMAHNGEINTLRGNMNAMRARESTLKSEFFGKDIGKLFPVVDENGSDSAVFDNAFELMVAGGRSMEHVMMMMVPEAFGAKYHISTDKRAFYEYHAAFMEPWDGPASIAFTDGTNIGAVLDRNGLRPSRYVITRSGKMVLASEVGVLKMDPEDIIEKGRLAPGKMILVDTVRKRVVKDNEIKASVSRRRPYRRWLQENKIELMGLLQPPGPVRSEHDTILQMQKLFGYTLEDLKMIIEPMARNAQEPVGSMGDDVPPGVLSDRPQLLYRYFKQLFAQVTNPPIDPYRENLVMSLMSFVGKDRNLLDETPEHCRQLKLAHPIMTNEDMERLVDFSYSDFETASVPMLFNPGEGERGLRTALDMLCSEVEKRVEEGCSAVIISDRSADEKNGPIPALLATSAVNHYLIDRGKRHLVGIIVETGEAKEVTDFAALIGFGASAVNPYLAFHTLANLSEKGVLPEGMKLETAIDNYITAIKKGLLKIMSKMGVSTIRSYKGAQIFEAVGLNSSVVQRYFPGVPSRIEGVGLDVIAEESACRHREAFSGRAGILDSGGQYQYRVKSEKHRLSPEAIITLHKAVRSGDYLTYKKYSSIINGKTHEYTILRSLFDFKKGSSVPLEEVEPVEEIVKRFVSSAMSFGSISKEAHETMAIAMNRLGAQSNSGEGGEDEVRYKPLENGDSRMSKVKQVASGRFGVTSHYLANAEELQIKMAQGAKPGEGGQLPGHKVNEIIAKVRNSTPGVMLISPPPHHDIYSIEDLAQLIYDLKNANPKARVSVKLVSEVGVGTIAAGVAKGKADMVLISGGDGGTGASPLSSIKYAGAPWEIGLAETQQTLVLNKLRDKIRVQVDGQLRTGRDVAIAALIGAEEFGFGTISLVALGCVMMRKCHLNTCPVGVATQDPELRKRFTGKPEHLVNYMRFVAMELREIMAELGFRKVEEMVGQIDRLDVKKAVTHWKAKGLDFSALLAKPDLPEGGSYRCTSDQKHDFSGSLDGKIIERCGEVLAGQGRIEIDMDIANRNRTVGTTLSYEISRRYGSEGLEDNTIKCRFKGEAGQSFGAFLAKGITFELEGDANDYMGKGLSGGRIILYPNRRSGFSSRKNIITGNVNLFGATAGEVFIRGMAGERFAVRNSGAVAVVEGVGDHGCEYMTGGCVVILGETGVNFAAGMSGGIAYVLDENQLFDTRCNLEMIDIEPVASDEDMAELKGLIEKHAGYTGSSYASYILENWNEVLPKFVKVFPVEYRKALERIKKAHIKSSEVEAMTEEIYK